jgi:hypothetical protein
MDLQERTMQIKITAEDAGWSVREAAWNLEERLVWRTSDAARSRVRRFAGHLRELVIRGFVRSRLAVRNLLNGPLQRVTLRARRLLVPVRRVLETKVIWPLADRWDEHGLLARSGAVALVGAASVAALMVGVNMSRGPAPSPQAPSAAVAATAPVDLASQPTTLEGVAPQFAPADAAAGPVPQTAPEPTGPGPAAVAWRFSQAFVDYEIGRTGTKTGQTFADTASPDLAKALSEDPPRLPNGTPVPAARVLNVVLGKEEEKEVVASVSLLRVGTVSEVKLTLTRAEDNVWKVSEVLG